MDLARVTNAGPCNLLVTSVHCMESITVDLALTGSHSVFPYGVRHGGDLALAEVTNAGPGLQLACDLESVTADPALIGCHSVLHVS